MGIFPKSFGNLYIIVVVDYVSKWIEPVVTPTNNAKVVTKFLIKNIFSRHDTPREIINDEGTHFCNKCFEILMTKYGVKHKVATSYHAQNSGQAELSNLEIKRILEKVVNLSRKNMFKHIYGALWDYIIAYKIPFGISSYRLVYGKTCHLPFELEHKAFWATNTLNYNLPSARKVRMLQLMNWRNIYYSPMKMLICTRKRPKSGTTGSVKKENW